MKILGLRLAQAFYFTVCVAVALTLFNDIAIGRAVNAGLDMVLLCAGVAFIEGTEQVIDEVERTERYRG